MDKSKAIEKVRLFAEKARQNLDVEQVILFGSYAKGTATGDSDIDVAVIIRKPVTDWLEAAKSLFKLRRDIDLAIEPVLIDASSKDRSGFLEEIRRTGELIYSRS